MASTGKGADDGTPSDLPTAVAQILGPDGEVAGAGFLVAEDSWSRVHTWSGRASRCG
ncbi:hypothetical protein [Streptomyces sp. NPDC060049]|uniref:hypothetical protein n=1 Tax=Streptomyces sp. NPDC060049 TaxID=3347046 RepID=UPI0036744D54